MFVFLMPVMFVAGEKGRVEFDQEVIYFLGSALGIPQVFMFFAGVWFFWGFLEHCLEVTPILDQTLTSPSAGSCRQRPGNTRHLSTILSPAMHTCYKREKIHSG